MPGVSAKMIAVTFDWKAASARAETNGRPEWAYGLRTGWFIAATGSREAADHARAETVATSGMSHCLQNRDDVA